MVLHKSLMRAGSRPTSRSDNSCTAASTVRARPSITASPQPVTPSSVSIFSKVQRGGTRNVVSLVIFMVKDGLC